MSNALAWDRATDREDRGPRRIRTTDVHRLDLGVRDTEGRSAIPPRIGSRPGWPAGWTTWATSPLKLETLCSR